MESKKYVVSLGVAFVAGLGCMYYFMGTHEKVTTTQIEEYKKTITELQTKLQQKSKEHTVIKYVNGVIDTQTTDVDTDTTSSTLVNTNTDNVINTSSKVVETTNAKKYIVEVGFETNKDYYIHTSYNAFSFLVIGLNVSSNLHNSGSVGLGLGVRF